LEQHDAEFVHYVYLHGPKGLVRRRLAERRGHFMDPTLLQSQFEALEPPEGAVWIDVTPTPEVIVTKSRRNLGL
jgi:gluconokinase